MSSEIFVYKDELSPSQLSQAKSAIARAESKMRSAVSQAEASYGYQGRLIFRGELGMLRTCMIETSRLLEQLEEYTVLLDTAPQALIEADAEFQDIASGWEKLGYGISGVFSIFSSFVLKGSTSSGIDFGKTIESNADKAVSDMAKKEKELRGIHDRTSYETQIMYGSKNAKTVSILPGTSYRVTKYTDYKKLNYSRTTGGIDGFSSEISIQGQHVEIESNDGTSVTIDTNAIYSKFRGELDVVEGNAYMNAGVEYDVVKVNLVDNEMEYVNVGMSGQIGVGAKMNVGFHDGKFTADASVALGVGVEVKLEFDYQKTWNYIRDVINGGEI